ncbi:hypothetical protein BDN71DRAFT_1436198 [Pleurotus eryngii]|uniref:Uncharacterized protein n=1 Tax=Pleurotus eryngii TaxID=5323 RepID=A0A9P6D134_PLEER|nr:hypothetical protein BDN71DRAFT_1436198 [Pleurotus eryngii]
MHICGYSLDFDLASVPFSFLDGNMPTTNATVKQDCLEHCPGEEHFQGEDEYLATVHAKWLKKDWKHTAHWELLALEQGSKSFGDFTFEFQSKNALLINTSSQLDETHTHHQLESHMEKELATDCAVVKLYLVDDFDDWLEAVMDLDEKRQCQLVIIAKELAHCNDKYPPCASVPAITPTVPHASMTAAVKDMEDHLPCLTPKERELLKNHHGCYTCHQFYVYHISTDCPNGFPGNIQDPHTGDGKEGEET